MKQMTKCIIKEMFWGIPVGLILAIPKFFLKLIVEYPAKLIVWLVKIIPTIPSIILELIDECLPAIVVIIVIVQWFILAGVFSYLISPYVGIEYTEGSRVTLEDVQAVMFLAGLIVVIIAEAVIIIGSLIYWETAEERCEERYKNTRGLQ